MPLPLLFFALIFLSAPALAIYKCETGGQTVYSDTACHDSKTNSMKEIVVVPPALDSASAQKKLQQEKQELQRLQQHRAKQDAQEERQQEKRYKAAQAKKKKCAESAQRVKWANEDAYNAQPKTAEREKQKARRAQEKHQLACS